MENGSISCPKVELQYINNSFDKQWLLSKASFHGIANRNTNNTANNGKTSALLYYYLWNKNYSLSWNTAISCHNESHSNSQVQF